MIHIPPKMTLRTLVQSLQGSQQYEPLMDLPDNLEREIELCVDSRQVTPDSWFIAYRGERVDSHQYLTPELLSKVAGVIYEDPKISKLLQEHNVPSIQVNDGRFAWAYAASARYGYPENHLRFIGITGTNGKTSTAWIVKELLAQLGIPCLMIGTLGAIFPKETIDIGHTTPDPEQLFRLLAEAKQRGIFYVVMEVSSHAVAQKRLGPLRFDAAAFTSFSRDHLDYHQTMVQYFAEKWAFITQYMRPKAKLAIASHVLSALQEYGGEQELPESAVLYGARPAQNPQIAYKQASYHMIDRALTHAHVQIDDGEQLREGRLQFVTEHAIENFLAALFLVESMTAQTIDSQHWPKIQPVPGRLEPVASQASEPSIFVDYAHTPDAIERTLQTLRTLCKNRLWIVFGCGGDRDPGKRPLMARAASLADVLVITSDNPRTENPQQIIQDILAGLAARSADHIEVDRKKAIFWAVEQAGAGDVILIAGKGHETYQLIGERSEPFDDRLVAKEALEERRRIAAHRGR